MKDLCQKWMVKPFFRGAWNSLMAWPDWPRCFTTDLRHIVLLETDRPSLCSGVLSSFVNLRWHICSTQVQAASYFTFKWPLKRCCTTLVQYYRVPVPEDLKNQGFSFNNSRPIQGHLPVDHSIAYNPTGTCEKKHRFEASVHDVY